MDFTATGVPDEGGRFPSQTARGATDSACGAGPQANGRPSMIAPETFSHLENIKKRAGYLWRFL